MTEYELLAVESPAFVCLLPLPAQQDPPGIGMVITITITIITDQTTSYVLGTGRTPKRTYGLATLGGAQPFSDLRRRNLVLLQLLGVSSSARLLVLLWVRLDLEVLTQR
jgi:hypothetical protein